MPCGCPFVAREGAQPHRKSRKLELDAAENVEYAGPAPTTFEHQSDESGRWLRFEFCPRCGTTVGITGEKRPGRRAVMGGTFDDPNWFGNWPKTGIFGTAAKLCVFWVMQTNPAGRAYARS